MWGIGEAKMEKRAYYARPISIDGTPQEARDHALIKGLGFVPYPVGQEKEEAIKQYRAGGMEAFRPYVQLSEVLFFRSFPDGTIGAGVAKEIAWATEARVPVVEFPRQIARRPLSAEDTRAMLAELGQR